MRNATKLAVLLCSIIALAAPSLLADWIENGIPISTAVFTQRDSKAVPDGAGGVIIAWADSRSTVGGRSIYAQRVDAWGNVLWAANGVPLHSAPLVAHEAPEIVSDGAGGAVIVWRDNRNGGFDIFAQRIDGSGTCLWPAASVPICLSASDESNHRIVSDGAGGAIVTWQDNRLGTNDIYAQRISAAGAVQWTADGTPICTYSGNQVEPCIDTDGAGGAIIAWVDGRGAANDIYAQRVVAWGAVQWTTNGIIVCNATNAQASCRIVSDDAGGAYIAWDDYRSGGDWHVYAQRLDKNGATLMTANGLTLSTSTNDMYYPAIASDGANGAIVSWTENVGLVTYVYAQRINYLGFRDWNNAANVVCSAGGARRQDVIIADGHGGAIIAWEDYRTGGPEQDIYAQKMTSDGYIDWMFNGVAVCASTGSQNYPAIASDGLGGAFISWTDYRTDASGDCYAQRIERIGYWGYPCPTITSVLDVPHDQGGQITVAWSKSRIEQAVRNPVDRYSLWRMLPPEALMELRASGAKRFDPAKSVGLPAKGSYYISRASGAATGWELLDYVTATNADTYSLQVKTLFDSTAAGPGWHGYMVIAHGIDHYTFWESPPDSGYSVDNLAPAMPLSLVGEQSYDPIGLEITWSASAAPDLSHYVVYRGLSADFVPGLLNLIASPPTPYYFDRGWSWDSGFFYKVAAVDIHGNVSPYALLTPDNVTGTETPSAPAASYLSQNAPNPFNPATTIGFGLKEAAAVSLTIYDVSGRLVCTLIDGTRAAGLYRERWDGRDAGGRAVASGVYFYRLRAGTFIETKKMVLAR